MEHLGLVELKQEELEVFIGGCSSLWCAERLAYEAGKAWDTFSDSFVQGFS